MEADIAAIKGYVEQLVWCGMVAAVMLPTLGGMYLFRLTLFAKDRAHKKVLTIAAALLVGNQAFAACDCGSWGGFCPMSPGQAIFPIQNVVQEWQCLDVGISDATTQCIDGTNVPCKRFRIDYRGRRVVGQNRPDDFDISWVMFFEKDVIPARSVAFLFFHQKDFGVGFPDDDDSNGLETPWQWTVFYPGCAGCSTCNNACAKCLNCVVIQAAVDGLLGSWTNNKTTTEIVEQVLLARCNYAVGPCTCGTLLCDGPDGDTLADHMCDELPRDTDGDGTPDQQDDDDDGDGIPDDQDPDDDGDGTPDHQDGDHDEDGDGIPDPQDPDDDGDGIPDPEDPDHPGNPPPGDQDGDGIPDGQDDDDDGDGIPDNMDPDHDSDGDGIPDPEDPDDNNNGIPDDEEGEDPDPDPDPNEDPGPEEEHAECTDLTTVLKAIGLKILGFDGIFQEDAMEEWETASGEGLKIPWLKPQSFRLSEWTVSEIVISPTGMITVPGGTPFQWRNWGTMSEYILTGIKAVLLLMYIRAFFDLVMGVG